MRYMFAVGPPISLTCPLKPGRAAMVSSSRSTEASLRLWIVRPWWSVMEQNVQPPKHPRMICTESAMVCQAGIFSV